MAIPKEESCNDFFVISSLNYLVTLLNFNKIYQKTLNVKCCVYSFGAFMIIYFKQFFGLALLPYGLASLGLVHTGEGIGSGVGIGSIRNLLFLCLSKKWRRNQNHIYFLSWPWMLYSVFCLSFAFLCLQWLL